MSGPLEVRCPIYGFIPLDDWEREIISQPAFQRLRRIRQLAWTDYVYPAAMHTRFEHSLGVMHMATMLYDSITSRSQGILSDHGFDEAGRHRCRKLVRLAALLHDVGHAPFSHAAEELMPKMKGKGRTYQHEDYSTAIIRMYFREVIENHKGNINYAFNVDEVAGLIEGGASAGRAALWQDLISGQLDADRMDYLLRDSHHCGVEYGRYDWRRTVATVELVADVESGAPRLGVSEGGRHAAEGMIIARYMMFNQVYFHHTRVILDFHLHKALKAILPSGRFPPPTAELLCEYIKWDDWRVLGALSAGKGGEHGKRLCERNFYRQVWETPEFPNSVDAAKLKEVEEKLGKLVAARCSASKSWYKIGEADLPIAPSHPGEKPQPLSIRSTLVSHMEPTNITRLYVTPENRAKAKKILES